jgi:hypothetical protein
MGDTHFQGQLYHLGGAAVGGVLTTGSTFWVDSGHSLASDAVTNGTNDKPFATVDYAIGRCTASAGDVVMVAEGHTETVTSAITLDVAGVSIVGLGRGRLRPALTASGAIDLITVTAANCYLGNLRLIGAAASVTSLVNIAAADLEMEKLVFEPGATPLMSITVASGGHRFHLHDFKFLGSANGPDCFMDFESSSSDDWIIEDGFINATNSGMDLAVFRANVDTTAGGIIKNVVAIGLDATALFVDFNSSSAVGEGIVWNCAWQHAAAATIANGLDLGGYGTAYVAASDGANRGAEALPATSAS